MFLFKEAPKMAKKLEGNGLFESSMLMLPEHREAYNHYMVHKAPQPRLWNEMERSDIQHDSSTAAVPTCMIRGNTNRQSRFKILILQ